MSGAAIGWLVGYLIGCLLNVLAGGLVDEHSYRNKALAARIWLLTPLWPLTAVYGLYKGVMTLWSNADIDLGKVKK